MRNKLLAFGALVLLGVMLAWGIILLAGNTPDTSKPWYDSHGTLHNQKACEWDDVVDTDTPIFEGMVNVGTYNSPIYVPIYNHIYTYKKALTCYYK